MGWRWLLIFELAALGACIDRGAFVCAKDADCGMGGRCEANGYCSTTDDKCESGHRYSIYAPSGVADECVASGCMFALGRAHGCVRDATGAVSCWGANDAGQLGRGTRRDSSDWNNAIMEVAGARAVAGGASHSCAVAADGDVWCWGAGQLEPTRISGIHDAGAIAAGGDHTCALSGGKAFCWSTRDTSAKQLAGLADAVEITAGKSHTCARTKSDVLYCWDELKRTPTQVFELSGVIRVRANGDHTCAIVSDNSLWCWGLNDHGQLGTGDTMQQPHPMRVAMNVTKVALGESHTCAVIGDVLRCWGDNAYGELGTGSAGPDQLKPPAINTLSGTIGGLAAGAGFTCAALETDIYCWGLGFNGRLADGVSLRSTSPVRVGAFDATSIASGDDHACAVDTTGALQCWGANDQAQLGDATRTSRSSTQPVQMLADVSRVYASGAYTCATNSQHALFCWGDNRDGQLGVGMVADSVAGPQRIGPTTMWDVVALGEHHMCAQRTGDLFCWGANDAGQLGDGTHANSNVPVSIGVPGVSAIALGAAHSCAVGANGLWCWGANESGQLGDGTRDAHVSPVQVLANSTRVAAGERHTCALRDDGTVWCWGANDAGQLGIGDPAFALDPRLVMLPMPATAITAGRAHTCALMLGGQALCWGDNEVGQLGDGSMNSRAIPGPAVALMGEVVEIAAGAMHTCVRDALDHVYCWGSRGSGQLADGQPQNRAVPMVSIACGP